MTVSDSTQPLDIDQLVEWARGRAELLYDGVEVAHRSCGIALAQTFGRPTAPYQSLRRGGITGAGQCGAIKAGELILGEIFGDPNPTGSVTPALEASILRYNELWQERVDTGDADSIICNDLTGQFADFRGADRHAFCTRLASDVAWCVARVILEQGGRFDTPSAPTS